jgi:hypothetical protein
MARAAARDVGVAPAPGSARGPGRVEILKSIRDELRGTNGRIDSLAVGLDALERRQVESEVRLSTELLGVVGAVREVRDAVREGRVSRRRVDEHERRLAALEKRRAQGSRPGRRDCPPRRCGRGPGEVEQEVGKTGRVSAS